MASSYKQISQSNQLSTSTVYTNHPNKDTKEEEIPSKAREQQTIFEHSKSMKIDTELNNDHSGDTNDDWMYDEGDSDWLFTHNSESVLPQSEEESPDKRSIAIRISEKLTDLLINDCPLLPQNVFYRCFEFAGYQLTPQCHVNNDKIGCMDKKIQIIPITMKRRHYHVMECRLSQSILPNS